MIDKKVLGDEVLTQIFTSGNKTVYPFIFDVDYGAMKSINCYIIDDGHTKILIDGGIARDPYYEFFTAQLTTYGLSYDCIDTIILTHHHEDHIGIVNEVLAIKEVPIYAYNSAIERLQFDEAYLKNKLLFFEQLYKDYGCYDKARDRLDKLKQTIQNGKHKKINANIIPLYVGDIVNGLEVIHMPGHSPDSILLYDNETKWAFSGDLVFKYGTSNALIDFDKNKALLPTVQQQMNSLRKCQQLSISMMFPGHQLPFADYVEVTQFYIDRIEQKCHRLVAAIREGNTTVLELAYAIYGEKTDQVFSLVMSEVIGYVMYAQRKGYIKGEKGEDGWTFEGK